MAWPIQGSGGGWAAIRPVGNLGKAPTIGQKFLKKNSWEVKW